MISAIWRYRYKDQDSHFNLLSTPGYQMYIEAYGNYGVMAMQYFSKFCVRITLMDPAGPRGTQKDPEGPNKPRQTGQAAFAKSSWLVRGFSIFAFCMPLAAPAQDIRPIMQKTKHFEIHIFWLRWHVSSRIHWNLLAWQGTEGNGSKFSFSLTLLVIVSWPCQGMIRLQTPGIPFQSLCLQGGSSGVAAWLAASLTAAGKGDAPEWPIRAQPGPPPPIGGQGWPGCATPTGLSWAGGRDWGWQQLSLLHSALGSAHPDTSSAPHSKNCAKF